MAEILGVSKTMVRKLVLKNKLTRREEKFGEFSYDNAQVEEFRRTYVKIAGGRKTIVTRAGVMAARCFECFDEKVPFSIIVRKLSLLPDEVRDLYKEYKAGLEGEPETREMKKERLAIDLERKRLEIADKRVETRKRQVIADEQRRQLRDFEKGKVG